MLKFVDKLHAQLHALKPVALWEANALDVKAGTSWVTMRLNGENVCRVSDAAEILRLRRGLDTLLTQQISDTNAIYLAGELHAIFEPSRHGGPSRYRLQCAERCITELTGIDAKRLFRDLSGWLQVMAGTKKDECPDSYAAALGMTPLTPTPIGLQILEIIAGTRKSSDTFRCSDDKLGTFYSEYSRIHLNLNGMYYFLEHNEAVRLAAKLYQT